MPLANSEIVQINSALQKNLENNNFTAALDILQQLRDELTATDEVLKVTKIGLAVGKLRKHPNKKVAESASDIVRKWKQEIEAAKARGKIGSVKDDKSAAATPSLSGAESKGANTPASATGQTTKVREPRTTITDNVTYDKPTREPVRNNCIKLIYNSLAVDAPDSVTSTSMLTQAESIESIIYGKFDGKLEGPYKQKMRSLYLNLKGNNVSLRQDVRSSNLLPETLCSMSPEEMASDERKAQNKKLEEEGIFAAMAAVASKASTDMFKCSKCGKSETTYYQMQTRSADEPMTTFITCVNCGKKWKM